MKPTTEITRLKNKFFKCLQGKNRQYEFIEIGCWAYIIGRGHYEYTLTEMYSTINRLIDEMASRKYEKFVLRFVCINEQTRHTECIIPPLKELLNKLCETYDYELEKINTVLNDSNVFINCITKSEKILKEV